MTSRVKRLRIHSYMKYIFDKNLFKSALKKQPKKREGEEKNRITKENFDGRR